MPKGGDDMPKTGLAPHEILLFLPVKNIFVLTAIKGES